jgi:DNA repair protein RadC
MMIGIFPTALQAGPVYKLLLLLLAGCAAQYGSYQPVTTLPAGFNKEIINRYLLTQYKNVPNEQARAIYYRDDKYLGDEIVAEGSDHGVTANGLQIVINCSVKQCNQVILAHNHPGQYFARASGTDMDNADKFDEMMAQAKVTAAYVIVGEHDINWLY